MPFAAEQINPNMGLCDAGNDLRTLSACAAALVDGTLQETFGPNATLPEYLYIQQDAMALTQLGRDPRDGSIVACGYLAGVIENHFCNSSIHLGEASLQEFYSTPVDPRLGVAFIAAHEAGHFIQTDTGKVNLTPIFMDVRIFTYEQWSDCFAGVTLAKWVAHGYFPASAIDQITDLVNSMGPGESSHGTPNQRITAARHGYDHADIAICGSPSVGYQP